jgi:hypothetical protein
VEQRTLVVSSLLPHPMKTADATHLQWALGAPHGAAEPPARKNPSLDPNRRVSEQENPPSAAMRFHANEEHAAPPLRVGPPPGAPRVVGRKRRSGWGPGRRLHTEGITAGWARARAGVTQIRAWKGRWQSLAARKTGGHWGGAS